MNILGISCYFHDSAACLVQDGKIIAAVQEERFTRKKNDSGFPNNSINYCLSAAEISINDIDYVVYYDKPLQTFERILLSYLTAAPKGIKSWVEVLPKWLKYKLFIQDEILKETNFTGKILFTEHHEAHAASTFYTSPFDEAAILTIDGVGEWATACYGYGKGNELSFQKELHFPDSVGLLYSAFTYFTGFKVNSGEYKMMGLAPYGKPRYKDLILSEIIDLKDDGSIRLNLLYFDFMSGTYMTNDKFAALFNGPPRQINSKITQREMDIAASIQSVTEEILVKMAGHVAKETKMKNLCLAGGVALNCVANGKILRSGVFENIWIQPAAGDAGGALGAALSVWYRFLGNERINPSSNDLQNGSYLGPSYSNTEVKNFLETNGYKYHLLPKEDKSTTIANFLATGKTVGYFSGRMEFGPRALGARSILGDPRQLDTQHFINNEVKFRESFRPLAPSVLEEKAHEYFDIDKPSSYMLLVADISDKKRLAQKDDVDLSIKERLFQVRSDIPAVTHVDYSCRIQTVSREKNADYYGIIEEFENKTGCAVIVNTSFNIRGMPIVNSLEEAYDCFIRTGLHALVLEDYILYKEEQSQTKMNFVGNISNKTNKKISAASELTNIRKFGIGAVVIFGALLLLAVYFNSSFPTYLFSILTILGAGFILVPRKLRVLYKVWMRFSKFIGKNINFLLLAIVYYFVVTPIALIKSVFGGRPLSVKPDKGINSYWKLRTEPAQPKERFFKRF
ncbi:MAG: carbamoyltransferase [Magnetococcales bacterium]|nr:carbamoyltransferase [Magnetococcales bacterium]